MMESISFEEIEAQFKKAYEEHKQYELEQLGIKFLDNMDNKLPIELLRNRGIIEGNVVGCLYSNNELYEEYKEKLNENNFITEEGRLFYRLGLEITKTGVKTIDNISIQTYLYDRKALQEMFNCYDGYNVINNWKCINVENFDAYLDTLIKYHALNRLYMKGFNILENLDKFKDMTANQVYDWHDYMVSDTFLKVSSTVKPVNLTSDNKKFLEKANKGLEKGIDIDEPILNYHLLGLHRGNILLHTAHSGIGKTSSIIPMYIFPIIRRGGKVVLLINEQSADVWRSMLITSAINNGFVERDTHEHLKWVKRNTIGIGGFKETEQGEILNKGAEWLDSLKDRLILYPLEDYSVGTLKKIIKKMMRLDEETTFILDTWKPEDEASNNAHAIFTEDSKELFKIVKPKDMGGLNVRFIATAQLAGATINQRYIHKGCLGKAKAIIEVVGQFIGMRRLWQDEYDTKSKYYVHPYRFNQQGKKEEFVVNPEKVYTVMFIDKNRYGKAEFQLLWESNLDFNYWKCIGYCTIKQDY